MPTILCIVFAVLLAALFIRHISYRRQVERLGRRLAFINENHTSMTIGSELHTRELLELAEQIEKLNTRYKDIRFAYENNDESLRRTIADLSHDIRTPLTSLDGYFQLITDPRTTPESRARYTSVVKARIDSLNDMLDELFTYAKLQDAAYSITLAPLDLTALTADTVMSFYDDLKNAGIEPVIDIPEDALTIEANKEAMRRIEQNILKNALMHGSSLSVRLYTSGTKAVFECRDRFEGEMNQTQINHIFDRFYKADQSRSAKGSGMGLAIAKALTLKQGGTVAASVEEGEFVIRVELDR